MVFDFLRPVDESLISFVSTLSDQAMGRKIGINTIEEFPILEDVKVAFFCVNEYRGKGLDERVDFSDFRKQLYSLFAGNWGLKCVDLGDVDAGSEIEDTYFLVRTICEDLIRKRILPMVIGGSQDLTFPMYRAYDGLDQMVNMVSIDSRFDFAKENSYLYESFLTRIIVDEPNNLFNFSNVGYQTYYNSQEEIDLIEKLYFEAYRLGEVSNSLAIAEPVLRDADLVSVDMCSVHSMSSGNFENFSPNGFNGKEICALTRYAGISDKVSSIGIFNFIPNKKESQLVVQMIWYFLEGYSYRSNEYPFGGKENYIRYIVLVGDDELVFYKSNKTERWWIEIPFLSNMNNKIKRNTLLPCTHEDYLSACEQELPNRWWKAYRRNLL